MFLFILGLISCGQTDVLTKQFTVRNASSVDLNVTIVEIGLTELGAIPVNINLNDILVKDVETDSFLITQWLDNDADGRMDQLLFAIELMAGEVKEVKVFWKEGGSALQPKSSVTTYSRFVPERTDDYTWENDKVAFRTYGPVAQKMVEDNVPGGTLSSGIDLWLKKVDYSIIERWYEGNLKEPGYYHINRGEGYDPYHVGKSRGTGGIGIWVNDSLLTSKNFTAYRTIATGPLRTVFELDYEPWSEYGVVETKRISLDLGSNFSKFEISLSSKEPVPNYTIGITLHKEEGEVYINDEQGFYSHWEMIDSAYVGEGIVLDPSIVKKSFDYRTSVSDQSQLLIVTNSNQSMLTYYAGFAWTESGQVASQEDWMGMLMSQAEIMANPVETTLN